MLRLYGRPTPRTAQLRSTTNRKASRDRCVLATRSLLTLKIPYEFPSSASDPRTKLRPVANDLRVHQRKLDAFQQRFNEERPHEALDGAFPDELYQPSGKKYSGLLRRPEYPGHFEVRKISTFGAFRLHSRQIFLSQALRYDYIGLEEIDDGLWNIVYYNTVLGRLNLKTGKITGHDKL